MDGRYGNDTPILEACASNEIHSAVSDNPNTLAEWSQSHARKKRSLLAHARAILILQYPISRFLHPNQPKRSCGGRAIETCILISGRRIAQLLQSLLCCRMLGRIEMNQPSRSDFQGDKHINDTKCGGHGGEEIASHDCFGVIFQESGPALVSRSARPGQLFAVLGHGARRESNLELQQQIIGDALFSPGWILSR